MGGGQEHELTVYVFDHQQLVGEDLRPLPLVDTHAGLFDALHEHLFDVFFATD